jgi:hypothetical protein
LKAGFFRRIIVRPSTYESYHATSTSHAITASAQTREYAKTPQDKPVHSEGAQQASDVDRAVAPYVAKARKTYPAAKKRFLTGLPPKYLLSRTTKLWDRSHTKFEVVFVVADKISDGKVTATRRLQFRRSDHLS